MKGSIIQLADGELKRVEDLRTEDFVQSAEVSGELKIDSSTVERIECSRTPNAVIIQFSVGENKAQVSQFLLTSNSLTMLKNEYLQLKCYSWFSLF